MIPGSCGWFWPVLIALHAYIYSWQYVILSLGYIISSLKKKKLQYYCSGGNKKHNIQHKSNKVCAKEFKGRKLFSVYCFNAADRKTQIRTACNNIIRNFLSPIYLFIIRVSSPTRCTEIIIHGQTAANTASITRC